MMGRDKDAEADLAAPVLAADPASALWRGLIAQRLGDPQKAREQFALGARAAPLFHPVLRLQFARAQAEAALALGDLPAASRALAAAAAEPSNGAERSRTALLQARLLEAEGRKPEAEALYARLARTPLEAVAAPALLRLTQLRLETGAVQPAAAVQTFEALRWRWRGDDTEVEAARALGRLELDQGRHREALGAYRALARGLPDTPAAAALLADQAAAFRALFLEGGADGLQPIRRWGSSTTSGTRRRSARTATLMVRRLAARLVDVDLLPQAAELLSYQVKNRLDGVAGAQVATDLALVYLMDRQPEAALKTIAESRTTLLPAALNAERRVIEARALAAVGRTEHALELLAGDSSVDALDVKADVAWRGQAWPQAGAALERTLGDRWRNPAPLSPIEENRLLRAGAAYSLAGDAAALARLKARYGKLTESARAPDALRVALAGAGEAELASGDFARAVSDADSYATWVKAMKARFREKPASSPRPVKQAAAKTLSAAG
jgi:tetratricopeptide (TPR) repeat protein